MRAAGELRWARLRAGLSQRALAARAGVRQSTIGRIEAGEVDPRLSTLTRLLRACGFDVEVERALGEGVDRSVIREMLALNPAERVARLAAEARFLALVDAGRSLATARRDQERSEGTGPGGTDASLCSA